MYSLIIVDYNTVEKTIEYIRQCKQKLFHEDGIHTIIIENGDQANAEDLLKSEFGKAKTYYSNSAKISVLTFENNEIMFCRTGKNLGYAKGNNLGVVLATEFYEDSYYILSNNDLIIEEKLDLVNITKLFDSMANCAVIGPKIISPQGQCQSPHKVKSAVSRLILYYWNMLLKIPYSDVDYTNESKNCCWVTGCFMFIRANAFKNAGMFDENTFLYAEEIILSERLVKCGYTTYFLDDLTIIHDHGQTVKKAMSALKGIECSFESNLYYYEEYKKCSRIVLTLAKINFLLFKKIFLIRHRIVEFIRRR
ncbi:N-acetylglucosaminyl-diphospho-decaprenol L-rhamnosyltransferase [Neobacillus niacini]|uniref:glycosyltransferase family 2 protein n=1 Tax=Neobacillus driksii TaxID=3035913 RepID=UPI002788701A|nr:glycosyltransferase family 2 protein [Neobacillus niacini]MDQ0974609.1 N-acetylglucosaminyl-diphospho-decaprenol L-rhamnosyltransferase [Neobacillus niacini]